MTGNLADGLTLPKTMSEMAWPSSLPPKKACERSRSECAKEEEGRRLSTHMKDSRGSRDPGHGDGHASLRNDDCVGVDLEDFGDESIDFARQAEKKRRGSAEGKRENERVGTHARVFLSNPSLSQSVFVPTTTMATAQEGVGGGTKGKKSKERRTIALPCQLHRLMTKLFGGLNKRSADAECATSDEGTLRDNPRVAPLPKLEGVCATRFEAKLSSLLLRSATDRSVGDRSATSVWQDLEVSGTHAPKNSSPNSQLVVFSMISSLLMKRLP